MLITEKMSRRDLAAKLSLGGAELMQEIRKMKAEGRLIETRDYIDPAHSKKRRQHFCVIAKTLDMKI